MAGIAESEDANSYLGGRVRLLQFSAFTDARGKLCALPFDAFPFVPRRSFFVSDVPAGAIRGMHAHHTASQLLFCVAGELEVLVRAGDEEARAVLTHNCHGLLIGAGVWAQQCYRNAQTIMLAFASEPYSPASYTSSERDG